MKRKICLFVFAGTLLLAIFGCTATPASTSTPKQEQYLNKVEVAQYKFFPDLFRVILNWYTWKGNEVVVNVTVENHDPQNKRWNPVFNAVDSVGNYGDDLSSSEIPEKERYPLVMVWPKEDVTGSMVFRFGPSSKGIKLQVYSGWMGGTMLGQPEGEFSLGR